MARPTTIKTRFSTMISFDKIDYDEFEKLVGKGNVSKELRAFIKERVNLQKNEEAQRYDPLGLCKSVTQSGQNEVPRLSVNTRQSTLFEAFATKDRRNEINKLIESIEDKALIDKIWINSKVLYNVADTKRKRLAKGLY